MYNSWVWAIHCFSAHSLSCVSPLDDVANKVRTDTNFLVHRTRYRTKLAGSMIYRYILTLMLGPIQQFWFAEPDTEPNWLVRKVRHDTLCWYVLTLVANGLLDCSYHYDNLGKAVIPSSDITLNGHHPWVNLILTVSFVWGIKQFVISFVLFFLFSKWE